MKAWKLAAALIGAGLFLGASGQASADSTCTVFNAAGSKSFPGAYIGTVDGSTCQIGAAPNTSGITDNAVLSSSTNPQIYEFYFGGGSLTVEELLGNQGTNTPVDVELDYLGTSQSDSTPSVLYSTQVPYQSNWGASQTFTVDNLGAGYYALDSFFGSSGTEDPQYEAFITDAPAVVGTPEPGSGLLLGLGLMGIAAAAFMRRRAISC